jgi:hypothetical protein
MTYRYELAIGTKNAGPFMDDSREDRDAVVNTIVEVLVTHALAPLPWVLSVDVETKKGS